MADSYRAVLGLTESQCSDADAIDEASEWLRTTLGQGECPAAGLKEKAEASGMAWASVRRAKRRLGINSRHRGDDGTWVWSLPKAA